MKTTQPQFTMYDEKGQPVVVGTLIEILTVANGLLGVTIAPKTQK